MIEKLYVFTDDHNWFVARDINHVKELFLAFFGESFEDLDVDENNWSELPDDKIISIAVEKEEFNPENEVLPYVHMLKFDGALVRIEATAAEWVKISEPGLLCSLDW